MIKFPLLQSSDIEVKVKQVTKTGALLLLYKTARTDAKILDDVLGPMNWTDSYSTIGDILYCKIGIREKEDQDFVYKVDCGIESDQDDDNRFKAQASDAFKRCCTKIGIGRELYSSPKIWANVATVQKGEKWVLEDKTASYYVSKIEYDNKGNIRDLEIRNEKTQNVVYSMTQTRKALASSEDLDFGATEKSTETTPNTSTITTNTSKVEATKTEKQKAQTTQPSSDKKDLKELVHSIGMIVKNMSIKEGDSSNYKKIVEEITGDKSFKCNTATEKDYEVILAIYERLVASGYNG